MPEHSHFILGDTGMGPQYAASGAPGQYSIYVVNKVPYLYPTAPNGKSQPFNIMASYIVLITCKKV